MCPQHKCLVSPLLITVLCCKGAQPVLELAQVVGLTGETSVAGTGASCCGAGTTVGCRCLACVSPTLFIRRLCRSRAQRFPLRRRAKGRQGPWHGWRCALYGCSARSCGISVQVNAGCWLLTQPRLVAERIDHGVICFGSYQPSKRLQFMPALRLLPTSWRICAADVCRRIAATTLRAVPAKCMRAHSTRTAASLQTGLPRWRQVRSYSSCSYVAACSVGSQEACDHNACIGNNDDVPLCSVVLIPVWPCKLVSQLRSNVQAAAKAGLTPCGGAPPSRALLRPQLPPQATSPASRTLAL